MKTKTFKLETFYERAFCDKCGGELIDTGISLPMCPPLYQHKCSNCGEIYNLSVLFPRIFYKEVESEQLGVYNDREF